MGANLCLDRSTWYRNLPTLFLITAHFLGILQQTFSLVHYDT
jgi:hypothetical protein